MSRHETGGASAAIKKVTDYDEAAKVLAEGHARSEKNIKEIYFFPDKEKKVIRLIELDPTAMPHQEQIMAFYFAPYSRGRIPFMQGIAMIRPDEKDRLPPPEGWGDWTKAVRVWPKKPRKGRRAA